MVAFDASAGLDLLIRSGGLDPLGRLWGRLGIGRHAGIYVSGGLAPSRSQSLDVFEWQIEAGVGYRFFLHRRLRLEAAALVGVCYMTTPFLTAPSAACAPTHWVNFRSRCKSSCNPHQSLDVALSMIAFGSQFPNLPHAARLRHRDETAVRATWKKLRSHYRR